LISIFIFQAVLLLSKIAPEIVGEPLNAKRLYDAVNVILSLQVARFRIIQIRLIKSTKKNINSQTEAG